VLLLGDIFWPENIMKRDLFTRRHPAGVGPKSRFFSAVLAIALAAAACGGAGFWYGQALLTKESGAGNTASLIAALFEQERQAVEEARQEVRSNLDALGGKLGGMQAELLRLNALGERLVQMAGLSEDEFDFQNPPALGGPEPEESVQTNAAELVEEMERLLKELKDRDHKLSLLEELIMEQDLQAASLPAGRPVRSGVITSTYGYRKDPITGRRSFHRGVDFAGKRGTDILAVADGLVVSSESKSGYGRTVEIRHANGLVTRYAHNQKLLVQVGDLVKKGEVIAKLGSSGRSTGPHLHFEVLKDGEQIDPMKFAGVRQFRRKG
jgi:murein DD-endopeptidase MepM/ murein hydrolase activator NlpD